MACGQPVSGGLPARSAGPRLPYQADAQSPVGEIVNFLREPEAGNPHIRFDERGVKTEAWFDY
jgi:hypothetical protein